jgi:hypothetical protein
LPVSSRDLCYEDTLSTEVNMLRLTTVLALLAASAACASSGAPPTPEATVPVFDSVEDVPCQYEVMRTVRGEGSVPTPGSPSAFERERERVMARVGARAGADAVLVAPMSEMTGVQRRAVVSAPAGSPPPLPTATNLQFEGEALRYLPGTCRDGR